ncbi:hypothetical protein WR25_04202 [Diploscapter pachys]|uniref:Transthyretin/hydroxyisourate hydrolase domain-containing protein n=1 Tax=Diploscapter pachys TaxID=2018661 RepID=A0A2A2JTP5_9BILA|nr:hypothetical protein WR25_04202 [Diploscapter pachys]
MLYLSTIFLTLTVILQAQSDDDVTIQGVAVAGRLMCGSSPVNSAVIKLIDRDHGDDIDDLLDETRPDKEGFFQPCQRRVFWSIPEKYVSRNLSDLAWMSIGQINLELIFGNEKRDCRHKRHLPRIRSARHLHGR